MIKAGIVDLKNGTTIQMAEVDRVYPIKKKILKKANLALVKLKTSLSFNSYVGAIDLAEKTKDDDSMNGTSWGQKDCFNFHYCDDQFQNNKLSIFQSTSISNFHCQQLINQKAFRNDCTNDCLDRIEPHDICSTGSKKIPNYMEDRGSPLINKDHKLVGILRWKQPGCPDKKLYVSSKISEYRSDIQRIVGRY